MGVNLYMGCRFVGKCNHEFIEHLNIMKVNYCTIFSKESIKKASIICDLFSFLPEVKLYGLDGFNQQGTGRNRTGRCLGYILVKDVP